MRSRFKFSDHQARCEEVHIKSSLRSFLFNYYITERREEVMPDFDFLKRQVDCVMIEDGNFDEYAACVKVSKVYGLSHDEQLELFGVCEECE